MTYTISGTGSGYWGSRTFTNAAFTFTFTVPDMSSIGTPPCCSGIRTTPPGTAGTVSVSGMGTASLNSSGDQAIFVYPGGPDAGIWHYNSPDFLTVANPDFSSYGLTANVGPHTGKTFFYQTPLSLSDGAIFYFTAVSGVTFAAQRFSGGQPSAVSVWPDSEITGPNPFLIYTFVASDTAGSGDLRGMDLLFTHSQTNPYLCWLWYDRASNTLSANFNGTWSAPSPVGGAGASGLNLAGTECSVYTPSATATSSGNLLTLSIPMTLMFSPNTESDVTISMNAITNGGAATGYQALGNIDVRTCPPFCTPMPRPVFHLTATPEFGSTLDIAAGSNLNPTITVVPDQGFNGEVTFSAIWNDNGASPPTATYNPPVVTGAGSTTLTVTNTNTVGRWGINALATWPGAPVVTGAYIVDVDNAPPAVSAYPNAGSGASQTFTFMATNGSEGAAVNGMNVLFAPSLNGGGACWLFWSGHVWLASDDGSSWTDGGSPADNSGKIVSNSQCSVNVAQATSHFCAFGSAGCDYHATGFSVPITFTPAFAGTAKLYMRASNGAGFDSGYQTLGAWTIP
jgi:hypothetical protein